MKLFNLDSPTIDRIIEMAWEDRTSFDAIEAQFGVLEKQVIALMRREMKESSFQMWRERVTKRDTKHLSSARIYCRSVYSRIQVFEPHLS